MSDHETELKQRIREYLAEGRLLHLATVSNGMPWVCHVWYAIGPDEQSIVFTSNRGRRHSRELVALPSVAGGIVAIPLDGLGQKVQGLSFEGHAEETSGERIEVAYEAYARRWPKVRAMFSVRDIQAGTTPMQMYAVRFSRVVLFDEVNYPSDPRQELVFQD